MQYILWYYMLYFYFQAAWFGCNICYNIIYCIYISRRPGLGAIYVKILYVVFIFPGGLVWVQYMLLHHILYLYFQAAWFGCNLCCNIIYCIYIFRRPGLGATLDRRTSHSLRNPLMSSSEFCTFLWTHCCRYEIDLFFVLFPFLWLISSLQFGATEVVIDFQLKI